MTDPAPGDSARWRVLHDVTDPHAFWSAANLAEAAPGVPSPLGWSLWRQAGELSLRWGFHALGALEREHLAFPTDPGERCVGVFFGRPAIKLDFMCRMGARIPGTGGRAIAEQYLGRVPDELDYPPMRRRWPVILAKMPVLFLRVPGRIRAHASATEAWWRRELRGMDDADLAAARETLTLGAQRFVHAVCMAAEAALAGAQPVYDQVARLGDMVGEPELAGKVVAGHGSHVETLMVADLWALSRGEITLATYLDRHGYHGPLEGEVSAHVWREEARPLEELARRYREQTRSPAAVAEQRADEGRAAETRLLAALPSHRRPGARFVLRLARRYLPLRGMAKIPFLQSLDVTRAAARRVGSLLVDAGHLDHADDAFYLTLDELSGAPAADWRERVRIRRAEQAEYRDLSLPQSWKGIPEPARTADAPDSGDHLELTGIGASPGVVEGRVRVVTDPTFADVEPDEILVATTTDPSWASIVFMSRALVVDIGGALSHAAVVAREMGIPCVMGTSVGTTALRNGDVCRVDGTTGHVVLISRATPAGC